MFTRRESLEPRMLMSVGAASPTGMEIIWRANQAKFTDRRDRRVDADQMAACVLIHLIR